eukprot:TRINITY_DN1684_c0_g1_i1.p1 TRINITY_DN1684_c0_g1~~TRINITY_DN1684_c0_g1_i1.p1  ORF type:complete len:373 (-),score=69.13 TRINITY_DN1684_c0_g1_i1:70-1188(-)
MIRRPPRSTLSSSSAASDVYKRQVHGREPNHAKVPMFDQRFFQICDIIKPKREIQATLNIVDIAGLVPGAAKGEGLGNAFLSHINEVDGLYHVVRVFEDPTIVHTELEVDPIRDLEIIANEMALKDLEIVEKRLADVQNKIARMNENSAKIEKQLLDKVKGVLSNGKWITQGDWTSKEIDDLNQYLFLTAKPVVYLINMSEQDYLNKKNKWLPKIKNWIDSNIKGPMIPFSADLEAQKIEQEISSEQQEETKAQLRTPAKLDEVEKSTINRITKLGYKVLDLINFFTYTPEEVRSWTLRKETKAPKAAGVIHTDFEKGFICAEVMKFDEYIKHQGNEAQVKAEGKYRQQGKEYIVEDGDVIFFKFNVGKGKK